VGLRSNRGCECDRFRRARSRLLDGVIVCVVSL
jgi:hypothetical protein